MEVRGLVAVRAVDSHRGVAVEHHRSATKKRVVERGELVQIGARHRAVDHDWVYSHVELVYFSA